MNSLIVKLLIALALQFGFAVQEIPPCPHLTVKVLTCAADPKQEGQNWPGYTIMCASCGKELPREDWVLSASCAHNHVINKDISTDPDSSCPAYVCARCGKVMGSGYRIIGQGGMAW